MQQRRLRLGDVLDDYCPRERRITNHAVVAMIDDQVKQTRCTTCDADHEYKEARMPSSRRKKDAGALADVLEDEARPVKSEFEPASASADSVAEQVASHSEASSDVASGEPPTDVTMAADAVTDDEPVDTRSDDDGPVHRPLIRATLPRQEGQVPERREPDFTVRQPGRGGREFDGNRGGGYGGSGGQGGQRPGRNRRPARPAGGQGNPGGQARFGGPRQGNPRNGSGNGPGQGQPQDGNRPAGPRGPGRGDQRGPGRKRGR